MPMIDVDIHPAATGPAADIVAQHPPNRKVPLVLYSGWFCPFVQRSWITLEELGLDYEYVEINPYKKEASFLALNPRGLVPTLGCPVPEAQQAQGQGRVGDDGIERKPLIESNVICEYLDMYAWEEAGKKKSLFPKDLYERARLKIWIDFVGSRIIPAFHRVLQHTAEASYSLDSAVEEMRGHLRTWIKEADAKGPYFGKAGSNGKDDDGFNMADVTLAPWAVRLWVFEHYKGVKAIPEKGGKGDDEVWERFRQWMAAIEARPSVKNTLSDSEHYLPIYQRYADNKAESELAKAIRQGRGVP